MKILLVLLDGLADRQHEARGWRTPLEAAQTSNLDALASAGVNGWHYPLAPGLAPSSFQAHFALFGYPFDEFPGRGLLEAIGEGVVPARGEVALRVNFVTVEESAGLFEVSERPDPRSDGEDFSDVDLSDEIDGIRFRFVYSGARQGILVLSSDEPLSHQVTDADPFEAGAPVIAVQPLVEATGPTAAARTAHAINTWMLRTPERLHGHASNFATTKWAGAPVTVQPFSQRWGLRGASVASGPLYGGLAHTVGLDHVDPGSLGGQAQADLERRLDVALRLFEDGYEFAHVHTKVPDHAGHRKDPAHKRDRIAELDRALARLVRGRAWGRDLVIAVTGDHATPSSGPLYHSGEGVPLLVVGGAAGRDSVTAFGEGASRSGLLGQLRGVDLMPVLLMAADRSRFLAERFTADERFGTIGRDDLTPLRRDALE